MEVRGTAGSSWNVSREILKITKEDLLILKRKSRNERPIQSRDGRDVVFVCDKPTSH